MAENNIKDVFIAYGFEKYTDTVTIRRFSALTERLVSENEKYNLTSISDPSDITVKHYADSLAVLKFFDFENNKNIIDIGAGAGFPSLPLMIAKPNLNIIPIDSSNKKVNYINQTVNEIFGYDKNPPAICERAEVLAFNPLHRERYDYAVSRAVARLNVLIELTVPFLKPGGVFVAYKGADGDSELAEIKKSAWQKLNCEYIESIRYDIDDVSLRRRNVGEPFNRTLILIRKAGKTPQMYPRRYAVIKNSPM